MNTYFTLKHVLQSVSFFSLQCRAAGDSVPSSNSILWGIHLSGNYIKHKYMVMFLNKTRHAGMHEYTYAYT